MTEVMGVQVAITLVKPLFRDLRQRRELQIYMIVVKMPKNKNNNSGIPRPDGVVKFMKSLLQSF